MWRSKPWSGNNAFTVQGGEERAKIGCQKVPVLHLTWNCFVLVLFCVECFHYLAGIQRKVYCVQICEGVIPREIWAVSQPVDKNR